MKSTERRNGTAQRRLRTIPVSFDQLEVTAQCRQYQFHEVRMLQNLTREAVYITDRRDERLIRKMMAVCRPIPREVRRLATRREDMDRLKALGT